MSFIYLPTFPPKSFHLFLISMVSLELFFFLFWPHKSPKILESNYDFMHGKSQNHRFFSTSSYIKIWPDLGGCVGWGPWEICFGICALYFLSFVFHGSCQVYCAFKNSCLSGSGYMDQCHFCYLCLRLRNLICCIKDSFFFKNIIG